MKTLLILVCNQADRIECNIINGLIDNPTILPNFLSSIKATHFDHGLSESRVESPFRGGEFVDQGFSLRSGEERLIRSEQRLTLDNEFVVSGVKGGGRRIHGDASIRGLVVDGARIPQGDGERGAESRVHVVG